MILEHAAEDYVRSEYGLSREKFTLVRVKAGPRRTELAFRFEGQTGVLGVKAPATISFSFNTHELKGMI